MGKMIGFCLFCILIWKDFCDIISILMHKVSCMPHKKARTVKRESGENPGRYQSLYTPKLFSPLTKVSHWETEKAGL